LNFRDYKADGFQLYGEFSSVIARILRQAIAGAEKHYAIWQIQHRPKSPKSLEDKLKNRGIEDIPDIEAKIKDLAGCRIIFYSNDDVNTFIVDRIIFDNFDINWNESKFHHPIGESPSVKDLYQAHHYMISLKSDRLNLAEYKRFSGLRCEIQIQTILNHAWSETGHDVVYKPPKLDGFGSQLYGNITARMAAIMTRHLIPAGHEFQKVLHDFNRLKNGQELFDREIGIEIESAKDNNERFDILQRYREYVVPNYDDLRGVYDEIRTTLVKAVELARTTPDMPVQTPFGDYRGKTTAEVVDEAMACFRHILYIDPELNFDTVSTLYRGATSDVERKHIAEQVEALASYNVAVWRQVGPQIQQQLTAHLLRKTDQDLVVIFPLATVVCTKSLEAEITGTSWNWNSVTFQRGQVTASSSLRETRRNAITVLKRLYAHSETEGQKNRIISALNQGTRPAESADSDLRAIVLEDSIDIVAFYLDVVPGDMFEIRERVEHDLWWMWRWTPKRVGEDSKLSEIGDRLRRDILAFRDKLNTDEEFIRYKTLVGFKSVFSEAWVNENFKHEQQKTYRKSKIQEYVSSINRKKRYILVRFHCAMC
jgi:ppGpp synthetase/RelA/SpoT-type nucleotidyltranferase